MVQTYEGNANKNFSLARVLVDLRPGSSGISEFPKTGDPNIYYPK